jgi:hypothetical protein
MVRDQRGRVFVIAGREFECDAHPAAVDLRTVCGMEAYDPGDRYSSLSLCDWLIGSQLHARDGVLVFATGREAASVDEVEQAVAMARDVGASVFAVLAHDRCYLGDTADASVTVPPMFPERAMAHSRGLCAVIVQLLVNHPLLQQPDGHWKKPEDDHALSRATRSAWAALPSSTRRRTPPAGEAAPAVRS